MFINNKFVKSIYHSSYSSYRLKGNYQPGKLTVEFRHPVKTVKSTLTVVANTPGAKPKSGTYAGTTTQTHAGSTALTTHTSRAFRFAVDASGQITGLAGSFWVACPLAVGGYPNSLFSDLEDSEFLATRITKGRPFQVKWSDASMSYSFTGVVRANGTASGSMWASLGACGTSRSTWKTGQTSGAFVDVPASHKFYLPIQWMHTSGLSTGTRKGGVAYYYP